MQAGDNQNITDIEIAIIIMQPYSFIVKHFI